jgi:energy-coupling factor transporter ATP-binding protein EcfA2
MQSQPPVIEMAGLTRPFGRHHAVYSLTQAVRSGWVLGFLGPNGACKTTTNRMLLGLIRPVSGGERTLGYDIKRSRSATRSHIGAIVESRAFYPILHILTVAFVFPGNVHYRFADGLLEDLAPVPSIGTFVLIVPGAMMIGSEYGYHTWKNLLIRRAGRAPFITKQVARAGRSSWCRADCFAGFRATIRDSS